MGIIFFRLYGRREDHFTVGQMEVQLSMIEGYRERERNCNTHSDHEGLHQHCFILTGVMSN